MNHVIQVCNRRLRALGPTVVANGIEADTIELSLDSEWDGLSVVLVLGDSANPVKLSWCGEPVNIPSQLLDAPGFLPVSVVGYDGTKRVTTAAANRLLRVIPSGVVDGSDPYPEEPDLLSQLVKARDEALDAAEDAREAIAGIDPGGEGVRGTQITLGEGDPVVGGIEGDSYVDSVTGNLWEFVDA